MVENLENSREALRTLSTPPVSARPLDFALVGLGSLALCLVATLYPARQAARAMPIEVFRS